MPKPSRKSPTSHKGKPSGVGRASASSIRKRGFYESKKKVHKFEPIVKYKYPKGTLPKAIQNQKGLARKYRNTAKTRAAKLSRRYNAQLERLMAKDYDEADIKRAKRYSAVGKVLHIKAASINVRWSSDGKTAYIQLAKGTRKPKKAVRIHSGKFRGRVRVSDSSFKASMRMTLYHARIRHYKELYGLNQKEAQALYRSLKDEKFGAAIFKALY